MNELGIVAEPDIGTPSQIVIDSFIESVSNMTGTTLDSMRAQLDSVKSRVGDLKLQVASYKKQLELALHEGKQEIVDKIKAQITPLVEEYKKQIEKYEQIPKEYEKKIKDELQKMTMTPVEEMVKHMKEPIPTLFGVFQGGISADPTELAKILLKVIEYLVQPYIRYQKLLAWWGVNGAKLTNFTLNEVLKLPTILKDINDVKNDVLDLEKMANIDINGKPIDWSLETKDDKENNEEKES